MSAAIFRANGTVVLQSRTLLAIHGEIIEGTIQPGMVVVLHPDCSRPLHLDVHGVEFVNWLDEPRSEVALTIHYSSEDELNRPAFAGGSNA